MPEEISTEDRRMMLELADRTGAHGVLAIKGAHTIGYASHDFAALLNYSPEELVDRDLEMVLPGHVRDDHPQLVEDFKDDGTMDARTMKTGTRMIAGIPKADDMGKARPVNLHSVIHVVRGHPTVFVQSPDLWAKQLKQLLGERT